METKPTDSECEAQIRRHREVQSTPLQRKPWHSGVYEWTTIEIDCLLRLLDAARAEISQYANELNATRADLCQLRALPEADVMERARKFREGFIEPWDRRYSLQNRHERAKEFDEAFARALTEYGDQRAHAAHMTAYREGLQRLSDERKKHNQHICFDTQSGAMPTTKSP